MLLQQNSSQPFSLEPSCIQFNDGTRRNVTEVLPLSQLLLEAHLIGVLKTDHGHWLSDVFDVPGTHPCRYLRSLGQHFVAEAVWKLWSVPIVGKL